MEINQQLQWWKVNKQLILISAIINLNDLVFPLGEEKHSVFDLTSKIMDFCILNDSTGPATLLILAEEELTALDLKTDSW